MCFVSTEVKWCGRVIDADGVRFDPEFVQKIMQLRYRGNAAELQQLLSAMNWIRSDIPDYAL